MSTSWTYEFYCDLGNSDHNEEINTEMTRIFGKEFDFPLEKDDDFLDCEITSYGGNFDNHDDIQEALYQLAEQMENEWGMSVDMKAYYGERQPDWWA